MAIKDLTQAEGWFQLLAPVGADTEFRMQSQRPNVNVIFELASSAPASGVTEGCNFSQEVGRPAFSISVPSGDGVYVRNLSADMDAKIWYR